MAMAYSSVLSTAHSSHPPFSIVEIGPPAYRRYASFSVNILSVPRLQLTLKSASRSEVQVSTNLKINKSQDPLQCRKDAPDAWSSTIQICRCDSTYIVETILRVGAIAIVVAGIMFSVDPALAYKGGGPYGTEVTRGQDLSGKDFSGRTLVKQDFKTSILRRANFKGAKLLGASFFDADLTGADLSDADLRGVDFSLANAAKANFTNANLERALVTGNTSFRGAKIDGADFTDVYWRDDQREYLCRIADGVNPVTGNATKDTLLCS